MKRAISKLSLVSLALIAAIALLVSGVTPTSAAGPAALGRTPWQMFRTPTYVSTTPYFVHGDIRYYDFAPPIPAPNDSNWGSAPNGDTINMQFVSRLPGCWNWADFTFFQSFVSIPANATVTEFKVVMSGADDGARVSIINLHYPTGLVIAGSYIFLGGAQSTTDLSPYVALGEVNRVVITQVDDCATGNNLQSAVITLNGTVVQVNQPPVVTANNSSVTVNEGQTANNTGTFSDPDGNPVALSASVGTVTASGPGTWTWSFNTTDGPSQSQTVTITANDGNGGVANTTFALTVNNVPPTVAANVTANNTVYYVHWTAANPGAGTASGYISLPDGSTVNVNFDALNPNGTHASFLGAQTNGAGTYYWSPASTFTSAQVPNTPGWADLIQLVGGTNTVYKVTLSQPIANPIMDILSLGGGNTITYNFDSPFTIVSQGPSSAFGGCSTCLVQLPNNVLQGHEGDGTIKFIGTYTTFSWTVPTPEFWHGFTFAIQSTTALGNLNVAEGQTATNTGTWSDPGVNDNVQLTASVGTVVKNASGTWNWSFATTDGPSQTQTVTVTATDKDGGAHSVSFPLTVTNVVPTTAITGAPATSPEGTAITVGSTVTDPSTVDTAAGITLAWSVTKNGNPYATGASAGLTFTPDDNGAYVVTLTAKDKDGGVGTDTKTITVTNVNPTANAGPDVTQFWGLPVALTGTGADVSPVDVAAGLIAAWIFGDGPGTASGFSVTHTYAAPGGYTATLTVKDKDGGAGSDTALATINKRGTTVAYTGATTSTFGFAATLSAKLTDVVDAGTALLGGRTITFTVNGNTITATTNASGVATATAPALLMPGTYPVAVAFAEDAYYLASSAQGTLTVQNTVGGKVTAGTLRSANNGRGGFNVQADGAGVKGELQFQNNAINFHAPTMTALGVSPDKKRAWFAGVGKDGTPFVAYVEDNGEPGRNDKFQIWIGGTSQNGDGSLTGGNVQIH